MMKLTLSNRDFGQTVPVERAVWTTSARGQAGMLEFSHPGARAEEGGRVELSEDGEPLFCGYVFEARGDEGPFERVLAYDQLRYLMQRDTYVFTRSSAGAILRTIASERGLELGDVADTGHALSLVAENKKLLDILSEALAQTQSVTGREYLLLDDGGRLCLRDASRCVLPFALKEGSGLLGYEFVRSIEETVTRVKLTQKNRGRRSCYVAEDSEGMNRYGMLQRTGAAPASLGAAGASAQARSMLESLKGPRRSLILRAVGDSRARAGMRVYVELPREGIAGYFRIERAVHELRGRNGHFMSLEIQGI